MNEASSYEVEHLFEATLSFKPEVIIGRCVCGCGKFKVWQNGKEFDCTSEVELVGGLIDNFLTQAERSNYEKNVRRIRLELSTRNN